MRWKTPFRTAKSETRLRILVTGSRGKSSIVRLLQTALQDAGHLCHARITGVVPREIAPDGIRTISRSSGAHVEEMRWWLNCVPASAQAIVLENSAISPDFQNLAARWLQPLVTVLTNTLPDHQEAWGCTAENAAEVLVKGITKGSRVVLPSKLKTDKYLTDLLTRRKCTLIFADPAADVIPEYLAVNQGLALTTLIELGLEPTAARQAMQNLPADSYDFKIISIAGADLAMAFSVNDIDSTQQLFESLQWPQCGTRLIFNHRKDRPERFRSFIEWLNLPAWQDVVIMGDRPKMRHCSARYLNIKSKQEFTQLLQQDERVFGCGNIKGLPFALASMN